MHAAGVIHEDSFREEVASRQNDIHPRSGIVDARTAHIMWADQERRFELNSDSCQPQDCVQLSPALFAGTTPSPSEGAQTSPSQTRRIVFSQSTVAATEQRPVAQAQARDGSTVAALGLAHAQSFGQCAQETGEVEHGHASEPVAEGHLLGGVDSRAQHKRSVLTVWPSGTWCRFAELQSPADSAHSRSLTGDPLSLPWPPRLG